MIVPSVERFLTRDLDHKKLLSRLDEDHDDWGAAADLLLPLIDTMVGRWTQRGTALRIVERGRGAEAVATIVADAAEHLAKGSTDARRRALDTLDAALRIGVQKEVALLAIVRALEDPDRVIRFEAAKSLDMLLGGCSNVSEVLPLLAAELDAVEVKGRDGAIARHVLGGIVNAACHGHSMTPVAKKLVSLARGRRAAADGEATEGVGSEAARALAFHAAHHGPAGDVVKWAFEDAVTAQDLVSALGHAGPAARPKMVKAIFPFYLAALSAKDPVARVIAFDKIGELFIGGAEPTPAWELLGKALRQSTRVSGWDTLPCEAAARALRQAGRSDRHRARALEVLAGGLAERDARVRGVTAGAIARIHLENGEPEKFRELLKHRAAPVRVGALEGFLGCLTDRATRSFRIFPDVELPGSVGSLRHDLEGFEDEPGKFADLARSILGRFGTAEELYATARLRQAKAKELAIEDDPSVLDGIRDVLRRALAKDANHAGALALLTKVDSLERSS